MTELLGSLVLASALSVPLQAQAHPVAQGPRSVRCDTLVVAGDSSNGRLGRSAFSPSGRMAWSEGGVAAVYVRADGRTITVGRVGEGPGELRDVTDYGWQAETLWVADRVTARVIWFTAHGKLVRTRRTPHTGDWQVAPSGELVERLADTGPSRTVGGWLNASGDTLTSLRTAANPWFMVPAGSKHFITGTRPFYPRVVTGVSPDRRRWCAAVSDAGGSIISLRCVDERGRSLRRLELPVVPQPVLPGTFAAALSKIANGNDAVVRAAIHNTLVRPTNHPTVTGLLVSDNGAMWVRRTAHGADAERWLPIDASGKPAREVTLPAGYRAVALVGRVYMAVVPDRDGIESMLRCPLAD